MYTRAAQDTIETAEYKWGQVRQDDDDDGQGTTLVKSGEFMFWSNRERDYNMHDVR